MSISASSAVFVPNHLRVLVVDDHQLVIDGLRVALTAQQVPIDLVNAFNCQAAQTLLDTDQSFDLILLDLSLPDGRGFKFLRYLTCKRIYIPVAILSASEDIEDVELSLRSGAIGFISKSSSAMEINLAIRQILNGKQYVPDFYTHRNQAPVQDSQLRLDSITPRQMEVLQLLAKGLPNKRICSELSLTEDTVKSHLKALFMHLNVHNRTECVSVATRLHLVDA
ncbi:MULTISPECIES: response regulator [unclassified Hahella]|uniref:response regulator n=1 Tax=unclassified Hahella TaxID=2624107 RepID=UPI001C1EE296|nr:response regulator transcription factor [Hahella sp. CR1]MBU6949789.1 response regulator transcription factor [Hahella sp. HN01]MDG9668422.1 response regulator transcription factor [Hahella sp. CR1]